MHWDHPARFEIEEGAGGVSRIGVDIAKLGRIVSADRQQCELRRKPAANLAEAGEISRVAGVINGMLAGSQHKAAIATVRILQDACSPVARRNVSYHHAAAARTLPPIEFDDLRKTEI